MSIAVGYCAPVVLSADDATPVAAFEIGIDDAKVLYRATIIEISAEGRTVVSGIIVKPADGMAIAVEGAGVAGRPAPAFRCACLARTASRKVAIGIKCAIVDNDVGRELGAISSIFLILIIILIAFLFEPIELCGRRNLVRVLC